MNYPASSDAIPGTLVLRDASGNFSGSGGSITVSTNDRILGRITAGSGAAEEIVCTSFARSLIDDVDSSAARTTLGLGSLATQSGTFSGTSSGTNTGDQTIVLTGDVTGTGTSSFAATLSNSGVSAGTYQSVTVDAKGRVTAGTNPTTLAGYGITDAASSTHVHSGADITSGTVSAARLGSGSPSASNFLRGDGTWATPSGSGLSDGDKGDITVSASGATWTIDNDAVTYAKLQNVSASGRILGRKTAAAGDVEECTLSEVLDFVGSATRGDILFRGASAWSRLAAGTSGHYLRTNGSGADPSYSALPAEFVIACSDEVANLTTGAAKVTFRMPYAMTLTAVRLSVNTAPTGSTIIVDVNENGVSIFSTRPSIDASEKTSVTAATAAVFSDTSLADDSEITIDIDQVGSTVAGKGLKVTFIGTRT